MGQAFGFACIKKKNGKKSYLVLVAGGSDAFSSATTVTNVKKKNTSITFDVNKQGLSANLKKLTIKLSGKVTFAKQTKKRSLLLNDPDSGTLVVTLSNPGTVTSPVEVPVEFVEDFD